MTSPAAPLASKKTIESWHKADGEGTRKAGSGESPAGGDSGAREGTGSSQGEGEGG